MSAQRLGDLSSQGRRALLGVLAALALYTLADLLIGVRFTGEDAFLILSDATALVWQALLVIFVWRGRRWAWIVGAVWFAFTAVAALAMIADPAGVGGYEQDAPQAFVLVQALLLLVAAGFWFAPGVRPRQLRRATPGELESVE